MTLQRYGQYCPISKACEVVEPRWTLLILSEMAQGSSRFNEIRRGVPGISPTLLAKRLRELELQGLVERIEDRAAATIDYVRTERAKELDAVLFALGQWAVRNLESETLLRDLNARALMWTIRRNIDTDALPRRRNVIRFHFPDAPQKAERMTWLVVKPGEPVDLCLNDPRFEVDLFIEASLEAMTSYWLGYSSLAAEMVQERIRFTGSPVLAKTFDQWLVRGPFAEPDETAAGRQEPLNISA